MSAISKEYAGALFSLTKEADKLDEVYTALKQLSEIFADNKEYFYLLSSPAIEKEERLSMLNSAIGETMPKLVNSFLAVLVANGHINEFFECEKDFEDFYKEEKNLVTAFVRTAAPLGDSDIERLTEKLGRISGKNVSLNIEVDEALIGGIVAEIDGKVYDGSLKQKLKTAKEVMGK